MGRNSNNPQKDCHRTTTRCTHRCPNSCRNPCCCPCTCCCPSLCCCPSYRCCSSCRICWYQWITTCHCRRSLSVANSSKPKNLTSSKTKSNFSQLKPQIIRRRSTPQTSNITC